MLNPGSFVHQRRQEALVLRRFGGPEGFVVEEQPLPIPGPGEVRVRVLAASVQFTDLVMRQGKYPDLRERPPLVLGYDVVGEVDEIGPGVTELAIGDRVADLTVTGSYARYRLLRADRVVRVPAGVESAQAATLILSWTTAYQLLHRHAEVKPGQWVLVLGAAGAVGRALLALGQAAGLNLWATARAADADLLTSLGAMPFDGTGTFDAVFDGIGEAGFRRSWAALAPRGVLAAYGMSALVKSGAGLLTAAATLARLQLWNVLRPGGRRVRFYSIVALRKKHPDWFRADLEGLFQMLAAHTIRPLVAERIALADVPDAHRQLEAGQVRGKLVICP